VNSFIQNLISNWHFARWLRAVFSVIFFIIYFSNKDSFALLGGLIFGYQAIFNVGCLGSACAVPQNRYERNKSDDQTKVDYKEIKIKD